MPAQICKRLMACILALLCIMTTYPACADIAVLQELDFGTWVVTNNAAPRNVTVATDGSYSNSAQMIMLNPPQEGVYQIDGLPPGGVIINVTVTMTQAMQFGGQSFTLDNFDVVAPDPDGNGETVLTLGARASTSGGGIGYPDGTYNGQLLIDINF